MKGWTVLSVITSYLLANSGHAESLALQQMRASLLPLQAIGVTIPAELQAQLAELEKQEKDSPSADHDNPYAKKVSEMSCSDDISGHWKTTNQLTRLELNSDGNALIKSSNARGRAYTETSLQWSASGDEFYVDYDYIYTDDGYTDTLLEQNKPKNEIVSCEYMGSTLKIGGQLYRREIMH